MRKIYVLNPSQSRRLIAKGLVALPQIQEALKSGKISVTRGSTNAFILEELCKVLGIENELEKADYTMGQIIPGQSFMKWGVNPKAPIPEIIIDHGQKREVEDRVKEIYDFHQGDIILKGGNAIDTNGVPAVIIGGANGGGTIGSIVGTVLVKGLELICPIGLEKSIQSDFEDFFPFMGVENMTTLQKECPQEFSRCLLQL